MDEYEVPTKRLKEENIDLTNSDKKTKITLDEYQICTKYEKKSRDRHNVQSVSVVVKKEFNVENNDEIENINNNFKLVIEKLREEKNRIERQKAELTEEVQKINEKITEVTAANEDFKHQMWMEKEALLAEIGAADLQRQEIKEKFEAKLIEQDVAHTKDKQEVLKSHQREIALLKNYAEQTIKVKEQENRQLEEDKLNLEQQFNEQTEQSRMFKIEKGLEIEAMKKENELIYGQLHAALKTADDTRAEHTELMGEKNEQISALQRQLDEERSQRVLLEENNTLLAKDLCYWVKISTKVSVQEMLSNVGNLIQDELQCSICHDTFVAPVTLNCSHTFCDYCINMCMTMRDDRSRCPNCRDPITTICRSLAIETFLEKIFPHLSEEVKQKRQETLDSRRAEDEALRNSTAARRDIYRPIRRGQSERRI